MQMLLNWIKLGSMLKAAQLNDAAWVDWMPWCVYCDFKECPLLSWYSYIINKYINEMFASVARNTFQSQSTFLNHSNSVYHSCFVLVLSDDIQKHIDSHAVYMDITSAAPPATCVFHWTLTQSKRTCALLADTAVTTQQWGSLSFWTWTQWGRARVERRWVRRWNDHANPAFTLHNVALLNCASDFLLHHRQSCADARHEIHTHTRSL